MTDPSRENPPLTRRQAREAARTGQIPIVSPEEADDAVGRIAMGEVAREEAPAAPVSVPISSPVPLSGSPAWNASLRPDPVITETAPFDVLRDIQETQAFADRPGPLRRGDDAPADRPGPMRRGEQAMTEAPGPMRRGEQAVTGAPGPVRRGEEPASLEDLFAPEHAVAPKKRRRGSGCLIALIVLAVIAGGVTAAGFWAWNTYGAIISEKLGWDGPDDYEAGIATGEAVITIEKGDLGADVSNTLYKAGVTLKPDSFYDHLIDIGETNPALTPGVYRLQQKMTSAAAWAALQDPANRLENTVALQEGWTVRGTLEAASTGLGMPLEELQAAVADPSVYGVEGDSLEGWLFPARYTFDPETSATAVIQAMVDRTRESLERAGVPAGREHEILTIASFIQREGGSADFGKVARVILNRLDPAISDTNQLLQMDSTAQYGFRMTHPDAPEQETAFSTDEQLADDNPWNTYVHTGLPAGPIANPGDEAITAAMNPTAGDWQYFVTVDFETGETLFASTFAEHEQNVAKLHAWCDAHPDHAGCGG